MTLGFAGAAWTQDGQRTIFVAADSRFSYKDGAIDVGLKTYELGGPCAMVASGHALPPLMAADLTRSMVDHHNRSNERAVNFYTTVKLFSFFIRRVAREQGGSCRVAVVGLLEGGAPCIANVQVSPEINRTNFLKLAMGDVRAVPVGEPTAARLLVEAMAQAKREGRPVVAAAVSMLHSISKNEGAFRSIGGGLSLGVCTAPSNYFRWPVIEIDGRRFIRGMDITSAYRPGWPKPEVVPYDEGWCAAFDQEIAMNVPAEPSSSGVAPGYDIDTAIRPETLFATAEEPDLDLILTRKPL